MGIPSCCARQGLIACLKRHPELLDLLARGAALSIQERLLTNDALTLAVMKQLGMTVPERWLARGAERSPWGQRL
jgi:hypothetical protein